MLRRSFLTAAFLGLAIAGQANAYVTIFEMYTYSGTLTYQGGTLPLQGFMGNTPDAAFMFGSQACMMCDLNFTTGPLIQTAPLKWTFAAGGSLTMTGALIDWSDLTTVLVPYTTLVSATFSGPVTLEAWGDPLNPTNPYLGYILQGNLVGTVNADALRVLGEPGGLQRGNIGILTGTNPAPFLSPGPAYTIGGLDIVGLGFSAVPEASSVLLLGTVCIAFGLRIRNKRVGGELEEREAKLS